MKKTFLILTFAASSVFSAFSFSDKLSTESDSLSYAVGIDIGEHFKDMGAVVPLDLEVVFQSIRDVLDDTSAITREEAYDFLREYFSVRLPARKQKESEEYMDSILKKNRKAKKTESGLVYEVVKKGGLQPTNDRDVVVVRYEAKLPDGTVFDSSAERGEDAEFTLTQVISGWTEGMKLVGKGGKIKLWIPPHLGYGEKGAGNHIGPNQALYFEVELIDVIPYIEPNEDDDQEYDEDYG